MTDQDSWRKPLESGTTLPFVGVYDCFSATIAGQHYDNLFLSGFGFSASHYGLPDIGLISWSDMVDFVHRLRAVMPDHRLLVDIDDGYGDPEVACHVALSLERAGAWGIILEDQQRPRRCGHFSGKLLLGLDSFVDKLGRVLDTRRDMIIVARTDADEEEEIARRAQAYADAGADALLVDGVRDLDVLRRLHENLTTPIAYNQIAGGKSPLLSLTELKSAGIGIAIYSTPCLFAAQAAIERTLRSLSQHDGVLVGSDADEAGLKDCAELLDASLLARLGR